MGDFAVIIFLVFVASVTTSVVPATAGLSLPDDTHLKKTAIALAFALVHAAIAFFGAFVGQLFIYLVKGMENYIVGAVLVFVASKMIYDSIQVLKGKRLYTAMNNMDIFLIAVLSSLNTFMAALPINLVNPMGRWMTVAFALATFVWAFVSLNIRYTPRTMRTTAFVQFSGGAFLAVVSIIYMFGGII